MNDHFQQSPEPFEIKHRIMTKKEIHFDLEVFASADEMSAADKHLIERSRIITSQAYAPYSNFLVGSVARLINGEEVTGTNQENASYPVGFCAERSLLATAAALFPGVAIDTIAITYHNLNGTSNRPISPCGMCRQSLAEYEDRMKQPIRLLLTGMEGEVYVVEKAHQLLPLTFTASDLLS